MNQDGIKTSISTTVDDISNDIGRMGISNDVGDVSESNMSGGEEERYAKMKSTHHVSKN